jgi:hypothetical protein
MDNELKELLNQVEEGFEEMLYLTKKIRITRIELHNIDRIGNNYDINIENLIFKLRALRDKLEND